MSVSVVRTSRALLIATLLASLARPGIAVAESGAAPQGGISAMLFAKPAVTSTPAPGAPSASASSAESIMPQPAPVRTLNPLSGLRLGELDAVKRRPLFAPSRRPPVVATVSAMPILDTRPIVREVPNLRLVGIIDGADRPVAILRRASGNAALTVRVGDIVDEWRVSAIEVGHLLLQDGEREQAYRLFAPSAGATRAPTARKGPSGGVSSILMTP